MKSGCWPPTRFLKKYSVFYNFKNLAISADEAKLFVDSGRLEELKTLFSGNLY